MSEQPDDHTLNACLARVIRKEIDLCWNEQTKRNEIPYCHYGSMEWNPVHDANQMEEVEAWLKQNGIEFIISSAHLCNLMIVELILADGIFQGRDSDKKRAFALAVQAMEQSNNNNNKED